MILRNQTNSDSSRIRSLLKSDLYQKDLQVESCTTNEPEAVISKSNEPEAVIRNLFSNLFLHHLPLQTVSLSNQQTDVEKIIVVLQAILLHSRHMLVQSTRVPNCWHACTGPWLCRPTGHIASTHSSARQWEISGGYRTCSLDTDPADQHPQSRAGHHGLSGCSYQDAG